MYRQAGCRQKERGHTMTYEKDIPDYALVPAREPEERVLIPITQGAIYSPVQVTNITEKPKTTITIEEDVLVPDTRPDLREILMTTGKVHLTSREVDQMARNEDYISLTGDLDLQTLYIPERGGIHGPVISISSRLPFREQWHTSLQPGASMVLDAAVEKIDYMVINERKYRVKVILSVRASQYQDEKIELFEGLAEEDLQTLRETVDITNVALRKKDVIAIREDLEKKDGDIVPQNILMQHLSVVENYKQATAEKIVINGFIYVNVLYTAAGPGDAGNSSMEMAPSDGSGMFGAAGEEEAEIRPGRADEGMQLFQMQERVEFTQFIPLSQTGQWSGSNVRFDGSDLKVKLVRNEEGEDVFRLEGDITTWVTLYRNVEKEIIIDGYHRKKNFICDFEEASCRTLVGVTTGETTVREVLSMEGSHGEADQIVYVTGEVLQSESRAEVGKIITEGIISGKLICRTGGDFGPASGSSMATVGAGRTAGSRPESQAGEAGQVQSGQGDPVKYFAVRQEIPFRCVTAAPQLTGEEVVSDTIYLKDLWAEKISSKQLELNAAIMVCSETMRQAPFPVLKNPAFEEEPGTHANRQMVVYIVKPEDTLWSIAKKFQSTVDTINQINQMEDGNLRPGQKLLILR